MTQEQELLETRLRQRVAQIAADLRDLGDAVEQEAQWHRVGEGSTTYGTVVQSITQRIMNQLPNLQLGHAAALAAEADAARAKGVADG